MLKKNKRNTGTSLKGGDVVICVGTCKEVGEGLGVNNCNVNKHVIK